MGRSLGATASSASQHPCALGQDYARCLAPKMQERRGFRSSTLHNLENYIKTENYGFKVFAVPSALLNGFSGHFTVQLDQICNIGSLFHGHTTYCRTRCYA